MHSVVTAKSVRVKKRQKNASAAIVSYADKCTLRLRKRMLYLSQKGLPYNLVTTAGARELACFVWGMMNLVDNRKTALNKIDEGGAFRHSKNGRGVYCAMKSNHLRGETFAKDILAKN